jgi:thienamycin biosynthesis protein ThnN
VTSHTLAPSRTEADERLRELLDLHFHPEHGSVYWLDRQARLSWNVCDRVRTLDNLWQLGPTPASDLRRFPLRHFIPRGLHGQLPRFILGETAGTGGEPCLTAYRDDEFGRAFVTPFLEAARVTGFPRGQTWLWVGPSGPHIIGKAVREVARQMDSPDPFSVDFDPRWAKRLVDGSLARQRYLDHILEQALDVLRREEIGVLFTTPPVLTALSRRMTDTQREALRGVHYGGLSVSAEQMNEFRGVFPQAVHLSGYGNSLFGVMMEVEDKERSSLDYFSCGDRLRVTVVEAVGPEGGPASWPPRLCQPGELGQVVFDRLDESGLLIGVPERDRAVRIPPASAARALGWQSDGLRDPGPPAPLTSKLQFGLY